MDEQDERLVMTAAGPPAGEPPMTEIRRRARVRRLRRQGGLGAMAVAVVVGAASAWPLATPSQEVQLDEGVDADRTRPVNVALDEVAISVDLPPQWETADDVLTPRLSTPSEVLTVGTADMLPGGSDCPQVPQAAMNRLGENDALVSFQMGGSASHHDPPSQWDWEDGERTTTEECLDDPDAEHRMFTFRASGEAFYALVTLGAQATDERRAEAMAVLSSFRAEPLDDHGGEAEAGE